jgi:hypothetical protein
MNSTRAQPTEQRRQLEAAHTGHHNIGQDEVDAIAERRHSGESRSARACLQDVIASSLQAQLHAPSNALVVVDHEHHHPAPRHTEMSIPLGRHA